MADNKNYQKEYDVRAENPSDLVRTNVMILREQNQKLANLKAKTHESKSTFVRKALEEYFEKRDI